MLQEQANESEIPGLEVNNLKTKMMVENIPTYVNTTKIENIESYVYLGQRCSSRNKNQDKEILRITTASWTALAVRTVSSRDMLEETSLHLMCTSLTCGADT